MATRIISIDIGNKVSGIVVVDSYDEEDLFVILHMDVINGDIMETIEKDIIDEYVKGTENTCILVLENIFMYRNFVLHAKHKKVKKLFQDHKCKYKCLLPSQKSLGNGKCLKVSKGRSRKALAFEGACDLLKDILNDKKHLEKLNGFKPRAHDVADALLSAYYLHEKLQK